MKLLLSSILYYPSRLGGPANTLYWLSKGLVRAGVDVKVVTTTRHIDDKRVLPDTWIDLDGIKVRYCKDSHDFPFKVIHHTIKDLRQSDILMLCDLFQRQNLTLALSAKFRRIPMIWSPRGELFPSAMGDSKLKKLYVKAIKFLFKKNTYFHATSEKEAELIRNYIGADSRIKVIPNYMELPPKMPHEQGGDNYFLFLGRIAPIKAIENLIEALALSQIFKSSNYILKIAGGVEDQFKDYYRHLVAMVNEFGLTDKVLFVGAVNGEEKYRTYANARMMFLVSKSENFGNVVIESLSQGTPVTASQGTPWDSLSKTGAGYWINNSPENIKSVIDKVIQMPENEYINMRNNAFELSHKYDIYHNIDKWSDYLSEIV